MSVKGHGNTIDLNPKGQRTWPVFGSFSWHMYRVPLNPNIKVGLWQPAVGLRCIIPHMQLSQLKFWAISLT